MKQIEEKKPERKKNKKRISDRFVKAKLPTDDGIMVGLDTKFSPSQ